MADSVNMTVQQLKAAAVVVTLDTLVMGTCLIFACKVYSDVRANLYSQIGLLGQPLMIGQQQGQMQFSQPVIAPPAGAQQIGTAPQTITNGTAHQAFVPFQGRGHRITPPIQPQSAV
jgi:hypothetical protein